MDGAVTMTQQHTAPVQKSTSGHFLAIDAWCQSGPKSNVNFTAGKHMMRTYGPGTTLLQIKS